nr:type II toxin-antitoxin system RelE/ParE family toxin [Rhizobium leucaenae]
MIVKPAARSDILEQVRYYADASDDDVGDRFLIAVRQSLSAIAQSPFSGSPRHFDNPALDGLRSRTVSGFDTIRVYYLLRDETVVVIRVLHGRRDLHTLLDSDDGAM